MTDQKPKTQTIDEAATELGIGINQAYAAAKRGEIPTIKSASGFLCCASRSNECSKG